LSFGTISGYQANSAVGHYSPQPETTPNVKPEGILLMDSGGQYLDGTTDVTRTITLGSPTCEEKHALTSVLKGLIKLTRAKFPKGTKGDALDALAREPLWQQGCDCRHGIGHGIGSFLNVHEGPQRLAPGNNVSLEKGMVTTIEPGVYLEDKFGVRLENVLITIPKETTEFGEFYGFETVTLCPIDLDLIETSLLSSEERIWLNEYHQLVDRTLTPFLSQAEQAWLHHETREI
jgi:Xaa-Pro aminopeptidase